MLSSCMEQYVYAWEIDETPRLTSNVVSYKGIYVRNTCIYVLIQSLAPFQMYFRATRTSSKYAFWTDYYYQIVTKNECKPFRVTIYTTIIIHSQSSIFPILLKSYYSRPIYMIQKNVEGEPFSVYTVGSKMKLGVDRAISNSSSFMSALMESNRGVDK